MKKIVLLLAVCLFCSAQFAEAQLIRSSQTVITKTKKEKVKKEKKVLAPVKAGLQQEFSIEVGDFDSNLYEGLNYIIGYRFNNTLFLGGGIGVGYLENDELYGQVYADIRAYLTKTRVQPFFDLAVGYALLEEEGEENVYEEHEDGSFMITPQLGVNFRLSNRCGLNIGIGAKITPTIDCISPQVKIGLTF